MAKSIIASGQITITKVYNGIDAYNVFLSANSVSIPCNSDGSNPVLLVARTTITVKQGTNDITEDCTIQIINQSNCVAAIAENIVSLVSLTPGMLAGYVDIHVTTPPIDGISSTTSHQFSWSLNRQGAVGSDGEPGPSLTSAGEWSATKQYYMRPNLCTAVRYTDGKWYLTKKATATTAIPVGTAPVITTYWEAADKDFAIVATGILLAEDAYIGQLNTPSIWIGDTIKGWKIYDEQIESVQKINGYPKIRLTSNGDIESRGGSLKIIGSSGSQSVEDYTTEKANTAQTNAINAAATDAQSKVNILKNSLKALAWEDKVEAARLGTTIIEGGYIKTTLLNVNAIKVSGGLASTAEVDSAINNVQVGGRNYILNSANTHTLPKPGTVFSQCIVNIAESLFSETKKVTYTMAFDCYPSEAGKRPFSTFVVGKSNGDGWSHRLDYLNHFKKSTNPDGSIHCEITFTIDRPNGWTFPDPSWKNCRFLGETYHDTGGCTFKNLKIESGNKATDWTLAPEDTAADAQAKVNALKDSLGAMAWDSKVELAKLGTTIIEGGYIKTTLLNVNAIKVSGGLATTTDVDTAKNSAISTATVDAQSKVDVLKNSLGTMAWDSKVELAKLGTTIIEGGYIKTTLLNVNAIKVYGGLASTAEVDSAINNVQVGGRNYILNSANTHTLSKPGSVFSQCIVNISESLFSETKKVTYTMSFDCYPSEAGKRPFSTFVVGKSTSDGWSHRLDYLNHFKKSTNPDGSIHCEITFTIDRPNGWTFPDPSWKNCRFLGETNDGTAGCTLKNLKIEAGNKASDWMAAPEDITADAQAKADTAQNNAINSANQATQYLREAFTNDTTITGGVIGTSLLKVGAANSGGNWIEKAGINGAGTGSNIVRFYAGGTLTQANNLVNGISSEKASFAVTEGGKLFAANAEISGVINADSGTIGGFNIYQGYMESSSSYSGGKFYLSPNSGFIAFYNASEKTWAGIGSNVLPITSGVRAVGRFENGDSNIYGTNIAAYVSASGSEDDIALYIASGAISGLAWRTRQISINTTLDHRDVFVSCYNHEEINLYLPVNPVKGKVILLRKVNNQNIIVKGNGTNISLSGGSVVTEYKLTGSGLHGSFILFVYDGQYWGYSHMNK